MPMGAPQAHGVLPRKPPPHPDPLPHRGRGDRKRNSSPAPGERMKGRGGRATDFHAHGRTAGAWGIAPKASPSPRPSPPPGARGPKTKLLSRTGGEDEGEGGEGDRLSCPWAHRRRMGYCPESLPLTRALSPTGGEGTENETPLPHRGRG